MNENDTLGREVAALRATLSQFIHNWEIQDARAANSRSGMWTELNQLKMAIGGLTRDSAAARQDIVEQGEKIEVVAAKVDRLELLVSAVKGVDWALGRIWVVAGALIIGIGWTIERLIEWLWRSH